MSTMLKIEPPLPAESCWHDIHGMAATLRAELARYAAPPLYQVHVFTPESQHEQRAHAFYCALATSRARWVIPLSISELVHSPAEIAELLAFADAIKAGVIYCPNEARRFRLFAARRERPVRTLENGAIVVPALVSVYTDMVRIVGQPPTFAPPTPGIEGATAHYSQNGAWLDGLVPQELWRSEAAKETPVVAVISGTMSKLHWRRVPIERNVVDAPKSA